MLSNDRIWTLVCPSFMSNMLKCTDISVVHWTFSLYVCCSFNNAGVANQACIFQKKKRYKCTKECGLYTVEASDLQQVICQASGLPAWIPEPSAVNIPSLEFIYTQIHTGAEMCRRMNTHRNTQTYRYKRDTHSPNPHKWYSSLLKCVVII